jgi:uncharacterized phage infection (PIP) family protein YhgE
MAQLTEQEFDKRLAKVTAESKDALELLRRFTIQTPDQYQSAAEQVAVFKAEFDGIEKDRRELTDPLNQVVKKLNAKAKPATTFLETAIKLLKQAMAQWQFAEEERQRKALAEAQAKAQAGDIAGATLALAHVESQTPKVAGTSVRSDWDFKITNPDLIPREFLTPDEAKIRAYVKAAKRPDAIPGVEAFETKIISTRAAS